MRTPHLASGPQSPHWRSLSWVDEEALRLVVGPEVGHGNAASGQAVNGQSHDADVFMHTHSRKSFAATQPVIRKLALSCTSAGASTQTLSMQAHSHKGITPSTKALRNPDMRIYA